MAVTLVRAQSSDAPVLTTIAFAAKRHWGYPETWIQRWAAVLTVSVEYLAQHACFVAVETGPPLGFASVRMDGNVGWVDHVWVRPEAMGQGIGRALFERCEAEARRVGGTRLMIEADPHAAEFYARMGAREIRREPAPMDGVERFLPIMEKILA
ncbi:MAG TPA: GNAT family N-acetyltransferase [Opitutaceae bacterium]|nr:GNAT family N-acetyltransferase [Opitutaceae bacterium]